MPNFLTRRWYGYHAVVLLAIAILLSGILTYYQWQLGAAGFLLTGGAVFYAVQARARFEKELTDYVNTLTYRVNKAGEEAVTRLPIGMVLYNEEGIIQWVNPYMAALMANETLGEPLSVISEDLSEMMEEDEQEFLLTLGSRKYRVVSERNERLLYFFNATEEQEIKELFERDKTVIGLVFLDNYDEVTQGMEDQLRSRLLTKVTDVLNSWSREQDIFLRRINSDRFIAIFNEDALYNLEQSRFTLLDEVRDVTAREKVSLTLSIGIGSGHSSPRELGALAQSSLDLALGRGGDQVAIKQANGKVRFYGGKSNAVEKRTRVRARVISHAIRDFVKESDRVIVMGHKNPDMDAIGAAIGMLKIAQVNNKDAFIVLDPDNVNHSVHKLLEAIQDHDDLWANFITPEEAREEMTEDTLLVVVDTHKPSLCIDAKLLDRVERVIVIDHHRRGEEFIEDAVLVYMEPYASSTAELVTELLEYQPNHPKLDVLEATALLSGIIVDTKSFAIRTGSRTFDAASYLKAQGADTTLVQRLMKEDLDHYVRRAKLVESASIYTAGTAIAVGEENQSYNQVLIAQAADTLLTMNNVVASFVISELDDGRISISARSLGDVNVQVIMENMNGGGHLTNAATQLTGMSLSEAEELLKEKIDDYFEGGETS
ncbi:DHH family phosphoesterase [Alteribacter natronophilus]|uniref:DHH family phosphoesterase n=1 Tax=Alteribacter natronophilus TaxID=2583810 RepID=UPI00110DFB54|nr:DHH family phosphoesterase [Alteribacter natronophilus]TMW72024.1 DHH family phosphoesterase [Alteribacter natronophilus]